MAFPIIPVLAIGAGYAWLRSMKKKSSGGAPTRRPGAPLRGSIVPPAESAKPVEEKPRAAPKSRAQRMLDSKQAALLASKLRKSSKSADELAKKSPPPGPKSDVTPDVFAACADPTLPAELRADLEVAFKASDLLPADYRDISGILEASGYPMMAACFAKLAQEKFEAKKAQVEKAGGLLHVVREGDVPSLLAAYYTGEPARFVELAAINKNLGALVTTDGVSNYKGWKIGAKILLPIAWNPLDKPLPPTAGGPAPTDDQIFNASEEA